MTRVAVTGASGFIGTALVRALAAAGATVRATDRFPPLEPLPVERFVVADVRDRAALAPVLEGADVVLHMAALPAIARQPEATYGAVNAGGTDHVLSLAREAGARRVVHMSSSTVYGIPEACPVPEDARQSPACPYSRSKAEAERVCARHADEGLPVTVIRPRVVVGPGRAGIFALVFALVRAGLPVPLVGRGDNLFQFTALEDLVDACLLAAEQDAPGLSVYNVGSDVHDPLRVEIERLVAHAGSRSRVVPLPRRPLVDALAVLHRAHLSPLVPEQYRIADADFVLDTARARRDLGFTPQAANVEGLLRAWDWWSARSGEGALRTLLRWAQPRHQNVTQRRGGRPGAGG